MGFEKLGPIQGHAAVATCRPSGSGVTAEVEDPSRVKAKMSKLEKECVTMLIEEHDSQTFKWRRILGDNEA